MKKYTFLLLLLVSTGIVRSFAQATTHPVTIESY